MFVRGHSCGVDHSSKQDTLGKLWSFPLLKRDMTWKSGNTTRIQKKESRKRVQSDEQFGFKGRQSGARGCFFGPSSACDKTRHSTLFSGGSFFIIFQGMNNGPGLPTYPPEPQDLSQILPQDDLENVGQSEGGQHLPKNQPNWSGLPSPPPPPLHTDSVSGQVLHGDLQLYSENVGQSYPTEEQGRSDQRTPSNPLKCGLVIPAPRMPRDAPVFKALPSCFGLHSSVRMRE